MAADAKAGSVPKTAHTSALGRYAFSTTHLRIQGKTTLGRSSLRALLCGGAALAGTVLVVWMAQIGAQNSPVAGAASEEFGDAPSPQNTLES